MNKKFVQYLNIYLDNTQWSIIIEIMVNNKIRKNQDVDTIKVEETSKTWNLSYINTGIMSTKGL